MSNLNGLTRALVQLVLPISMPFMIGCESGGVGDPCIPEDEYRTDFSGYAETEVNLERRSFQCETRVCLVNHFRGRVSCPYGQDAPIPESGLSIEDANEELVTHTEHCTVPGNRDDKILVPVRPQLQARRPEQAVYCSCRCDGPDKSAAYCECPNGFVCQELVTDLGLGREQLVGSYCVRSGTEIVNATNIPQTPCNYDDKSTCGEEFHQD
jgi:hypothetical protein